MAVAETCPGPINDSEKMRGIQFGTLLKEFLGGNEEAAHYYGRVFDCLKKSMGVARVGYKVGEGGRSEELEILFMGQSQGHLMFKLRKDGFSILKDGKGFKVAGKMSLPPRGVNCQRCREGGITFPFASEDGAVVLVRVKNGRTETGLVNYVLPTSPASAAEAAAGTSSAGKS